MQVLSRIKMEIRRNFGGGGLLAFLGVGSLFFFRGGSLIFANRVDFTPLAPPPSHAYDRAMHCKLP